MKKLLLTFVAAALAATSFAQSLSIVATDPEGTFETPAVDNTLNSTLQFLSGPVQILSYDFYIKNNSSQGGTVQVDSLVSINDYARAHTSAPSLCYNMSCYSPGQEFPPFEIEAYGEYRGGAADFPQPEKGSEMHMQLIYTGTPEEGTGEYKFQLQFEHDDAPSVFFININFTMGNASLISTSRWATAWHLLRCWATCASIRMQPATWWLTMASAMTANAHCRSSRLPDRKSSSALSMVQTAR